MSYMCTVADWMNLNSKVIFLQLRRITFPLMSFPRRITCVLPYKIQYDIMQITRCTLVCGFGYAYIVRNVFVSILSCTLYFVL